MEIEWMKTQGFIRYGITSLLVPPSFFFRRGDGKNDELIHGINNITAILIADDAIRNIQAENSWKILRRNHTLLCSTNGHISWVK